MPHARAKRSAKLAADNPLGTPLKDCRTRYVHYTTADAALKIIESKRLWMRSTTCMADFREVEHGYDMLGGFFSDQANYRHFCQACDDCAPGMAKEAIDLFNGWWSHIRFGIYVASVSEHVSSEDRFGRLSMWRAFGSGQPRVAVVISVPWISGAVDAMGLSFNPVTYMGRDGTHSMIQCVMGNVVRKRDFLRQQGPEQVKTMLFSMLLSGVACVKHEGFSEEREWRAVLAPKLRTSDLLESVTETVRGIPQLVYKIPLDETKSPLISGLEFSRIFDRIIIGPSPYPFVMADAFARALEAAGVSDASSKVCASDIPIRE